jgi:signal transduction histidine kinase
MKRLAESSQWIFYLTVACLFGAVALRSAIRYQGYPQLGPVLGLLLAWLILLLVSETALPPERSAPKLAAAFPVYLILQTILIVAFLLMPIFPDYFAILFAILSMQIMRRFSPKVGAIWIGLFALLTALSLARLYGAPQALTFALIYTAVNTFLAYYSLTAYHARAARAQNLALGQELQATNRQLQTYAKQIEQMTVVQERHRLARELHDSVTQTIFSMTLTTQSALVLMERDPGRLRSQLDRLTQLAQSALAEMRVLISELRPAKVAEGGLAAALRRHLADRWRLETLSVSLEVEGNGRLAPAEEQGLFRIAQEALNNIVKHAQASQACIRLHLVEPFWMEIQDQGRGFDLSQAQNSGRVGLASMRERAEEIKWNLQITTSPGAGTCIRAEKERQP